MGISPMHLFVLAVIGLLFFGPSKLPGLGKSLGEAIRGFKNAMDDVKDDVKDNVSQVNITEKNNETTVAANEASTEHSVDVAQSTKPKTPVT